MTLKQLIKLENKDFSEIVSVNLGEKTKYRYIVPATKTVAKNLKLYKKIYKVSNADIDANFLLLPKSEFNPFITECAIYDASKKCIAVAAPATDDNNNEVIQFNKKTSKALAKHFRALWKKYKRSNP